MKPSRTKVRCSAVAARWILAGAFCAVLTGSSPAADTHQTAVKELLAWEESIVTIEVSRKQYDYYQPWTRRPGRALKTGIVIGEKACWNQGYGRDAMCLMLKYGFCTLNLHRIFLRVYESNIRGIKAYEHAGFKHEGRMRQGRFQDGKFIDVLLMSALSSEWQDPDFV